MALSNELKAYVIDLRRDFHMHPELPLQEARTSERVCEELGQLGIPYEIAGEKNVIAKLDFGPGKRLAIRADMDALPVQEMVDVPWKSQSDGVMHACGHDGHTAALLGTARSLLDMKETLRGTVYLCFQQAEEKGMCADECVAYLQAQGGVDYAISVHLNAVTEVGQIDLQPGVRASGAYVFYIDIQGTGGHGSRPDLVVNPLTIACDIYQRLITIPVNRHNAANTCVVSPCVIQAGNRFNVIPDKAHMEGTIRFFGKEDGEILLEKVRTVAEKTAELYGGKAVVTTDSVAKYPIVNDASATALGLDAARDVGLSAIQVPPSTGSDNFAEFLHAFPGFYAMIGCHSSREGTSGLHHAPEFDIDESALPKVVEFFCACAKRFCS